MKLDGNKKFVLLGLILLIVAGIIVVVLKGFNLPVTYQKHEAINFKVGNNIDMEKLNNICKEVFGDKEYNLKELELFGDSATISAQNFTDEEKNSLVEKINAEFGSNFAVPKEEKVEATTETPAADTSATETPAAETPATTEETKKTEINVYKVPNYRLRDMARIYVKRSIIVAIVIGVYIFVRFHSIKPIEKIVKLVASLVITILVILGVIAILRLPITPVLINLLVVYALAFTVYYFGTLEKALANDEEN
ncbi:MAG: hypothetical protein K6D97_04140 [Clostridia bacterium]|nr:hypothetical protein [Clostridia bacterium]